MKNPQGRQKIAARELLIFEGIPGWMADHKPWKSTIFYRLEVHRSPAAFYHSKDLPSSKKNHHRIKVVVDVSWDNSPRFHHHPVLQDHVSSKILPITKHHGFTSEVLWCFYILCNSPKYCQESRVKQSLQNAETETTNIFDSKIHIRQWPNKSRSFMFRSWQGVKQQWLVK